MKLESVAKNLALAGVEHVYIRAQEVDATPIHFHSASERAAQRREAKRYRQAHRSELKRYAKMYQKHRKTHRADPRRSKIAHQVAVKYR